MYFGLMVLLFVGLLIRCEWLATHEPHNVRFALRYAIMRWLLFMAIVWLTAAIIRQHLAAAYLSFLPPPHPGVTNKPVGPLLCATGFDRDVFSITNLQIAWGKPLPAPRLWPSP
jgi:hypothetical protein